MIGRREIKELLILGRLQIRECPAAELQYVVMGFFESIPIKQNLFLEFLERAHQRGWIHPCKANKASFTGAEQPLWQISSPGRERLQQLMRRESARGDPFRELFRAKLLNLSHVDYQVRQSIARDYIRRVRGLQIQAICMHGVFQHDSVLPLRHRSTVLRAIRHDRAVAEAEIDWMRNELSEYL